MKVLQVLKALTGTIDAPLSEYPVREIAIIVSALWVACWMKIFWSEAHHSVKLFAEDGLVTFLSFAIITPIGLTLGPIVRKLSTPKKRVGPRKKK